MNTQAVQLGEVQETLLIPLYGRAVASRSPKSVLHDTKAQEIVDQLDYDFSLMEGQPSLQGAVLRTLTYDHLLKELLGSYSEATVVELGCGLNTRFERLNDHRLRWFDLDMPDVYALWQKFFKENERRTFLPYSAFDESWVVQVKETNSTPPYIFISEASTIYFSEEQNRQLFALLAKHFPGCYYIFDTATDYFIRRQNKHDTLKFFSARIQWEVNDIQEVAAWDEQYHQLRSVNFFTNPPEHLKQQISLSYRMLGKILGIFNAPFVRQYQLNVFQLAGTPVAGTPVGSIHQGADHLEHGSEQVQG
ncbi:MAG: class I SAM-dependent methyltransferase [Bacteroidota bacterium]